MPERYHLDFAARELKNRRGKYAVSIAGIALSVALRRAPEVAGRRIF